MRDADVKSYAYHRGDMTAARDLMKALARSRRALARDARDLLRDLGYTGAFATKAEARAWLTAPINDAARERLIAMATARLDPEDAQRIIDRVMSISRQFNRKRALSMIERINRPSLINALSKAAEPHIRAVANEAVGRQYYEVMKGVGVGFDVTRPGVRIAEAATKQAIGSFEMIVLPWNKDVVQQDVIEGVLGGRSVNEISRAVESKHELELWKAKRLVRTIHSDTAAIAELRTLKATGVEEYQFVATLDEATCPECGSLDGRIFKVDTAQYASNQPPIHPNCRCVLIAVIDPEIKATIQRAARDSSGRNIQVSPDMTYGDWVEIYGTPAMKRAYARAGEPIGASVPSPVRLIYPPRQLQYGASV